MEEDILYEFRNIVEESRIEDNTDYYMKLRDTLDFIENILKENENLKQAIKINQDLYETKCNENKELEEENKRLNTHKIIGRIDAIKIEDLEDVLKPYYISKAELRKDLEHMKNAKATGIKQLLMKKGIIGYLEKLLS